MTGDLSWLRQLVRDIPDYPEPGVMFRDITPLLADVDAFRFTVDHIADRMCGSRVDVVVGIEARGFILAAPIAYRCGSGFIPVRKAGKLPHDTHAEDYTLEYGDDQLEIHADAVPPGSQVLIVDDVLATGGTANATARLIERSGGSVCGLSFLVELEALQGRARLDGYEVNSLLSFP